MGGGEGTNLDHVLSVVRVEEKLARLGVGDELEVVVVAAHGQHVRGRVDGEVLAKALEHLGGVGLELEGVHERVRGRAVGWLVVALGREGDLLYKGEVLDAQRGALVGPRLVPDSHAHAQHHTGCERVELVHAIDDLALDVFGQRAIRVLLRVLLQLLHHVERLELGAFEAAELVHQLVALGHVDGRVGRERLGGRRALVGRDEDEVRQHRRIRDYLGNGHRRRILLLMLQLLFLLFLLLVAQRRRCGRVIILRRVELDGNVRLADQWPRAAIPHHVSVLSCVCHSASKRRRTGGIAMSYYTLHVPADRS